MLRRCPEIMRQNPTLNFLSRNYETLSRNCEILSRNYETASHKIRPFINAKRRPKHRPSLFKDLQIDIIASKTSQTTDRIIETCRLDVLTTGYRHHTKCSENEVEWGDVDHSLSWPTRLAKDAWSVWCHLTRQHSVEQASTCRSGVMSLTSSCQDHNRDIGNTTVHPFGNWLTPIK